MRRLVRVAPPVAALAALAVVPWLAGTYTVGIVIDATVFALFAMSLNLLVGWGGLPSLGHAAFFGVGAYAIGIVVTKTDVSSVVMLAGAFAAAGALGLAFGWMALRTKDAYFLMVTLGLAEVLGALALGLRSFTGGDDGLPGVSRPGLPFGGTLQDPMAFYYFVTGIAVLGIAAIALLKTSHFGLALRGTAGAERRMRVLGYRVGTYRYMAFVLAGAFAGLAGGLSAWDRGFVSPDFFSVQRSAEALIMVILGGKGTVSGPVVGAFVIVLASSYVSTWTVIWPLVLGALYVGVVWLLPDGIVGGAKRAVGVR